MTYGAITEAIRRKDPGRILFTIEFFPEEGKYHYDGHRNCNILFAPQETKKHKGLCPVCGKRLTVGVMNRVEELADRGKGRSRTKPSPPCIWFLWKKSSPTPWAWGPTPPSVEKEYLRLVERGGSEFDILMELSPEELAAFTPPMILEGILRVREGRLQITPGYDGVFGKIQIFTPAEREKGPVAEERPEADQMKLL